MRITHSDPQATAIITTINQNFKQSEYGGLETDTGSPASSPGGGLTYTEVATTPTNGSKRQTPGKSAMAPRSPSSEDRKERSAAPA